MENRKRRIYIGICLRILFLFLAIGITYFAMVMKYRGIDVDKSIICKVNLDNNDTVVITYEEKDDKVNYYAECFYSLNETDINIICYSNNTHIENICEEILIFTSDKILDTFEFDIIYNGVMRHYSISR